MPTNMVLTLCDYELRRMCKEIDAFMESSKYEDGNIRINAASAWKLVGTLLDDMHTLHKEIEGAKEEMDAEMD